MRNRVEATRFPGIVYWALLSFAAWVVVTPPFIWCARADEAPAPSDASSAEETSYRVTGRVVLNADGALAAGATVYVDGRPPRETAADENGEFSFEHVRPGSRLWAKRGHLVSRSSGAQLQWVRNEFGPRRMRRVELQLYEPVTLNVLVRARSSGQAVAGAVVLPGGENLDCEFRTDASGEAGVGPLAPGNWQLEVHADGFALEQRSLDVKYDGQTDEFLLAPGGIVEGTVRGQAGQPLANVPLTAVLKNDGNRNFGSAVTNAEGHYLLANVLHGAAVKVAILGLANRWQTVVLTGERQTLDFVIAPVPLQEELDGIVVDPLGRPIEGALLGDEGRTDRDGRFHAAGRSRAGSIFVRTKGFVPRMYKPDVEDVKAEARIVLHPGHRIDGLVVDETGHPLSDVDVRVDTIPPVSLPIVSTDDDGRFEYDTLPADCVFSFSKSGFRRMHHQELALDANGAIPVVMQPAGVLFGQVVDANSSRPIRDFHVRCSSNLSVRLSDPGEEFRTADGTFEIVNDGLAMGVPIEVILDADGYERLVVSRAKVQRRDEAEPVWFRLKPEEPTNVVTYAGRLLDAAGAPVVNAEVRLIGTAGSFSGFRQGTLPGGFNFIRNGRLASYANVLRFGSATTDQEGRFEFVRIPRRAAVELAWWRPGVAPARRPRLEVLSDAERSALEIRVDAAARIVGPIDRTAFPGARRVSVTSDDRSREGASEEFDEDQETFELTDLAPGTYRVQLLGPLDEASAVRPPPRGIPGFYLRLRANQRLPKKLAETTVTLAVGEVRRVEFGK